MAFQIVAIDKIFHIRIAIFLETIPRLYFIVVMYDRSVHLTIYTDLSNKHHSIVILPNLLFRTGLVLRRVYHLCTIWPANRKRKYQVFSSPLFFSIVEATCTCHQDVWIQKKATPSEKRSFIDVSDAIFRKFV